MDYEKKYKEALERAKKFSEKPYLEDSKGIVEYIFPELKESEDDRMFYALLEGFKDFVDMYSEWHNGVTIAQLITWLKRKGEQKPNYFHHEVDLSGCSEEYRKAYYDGWNNCNQQHEQLKAEQKPAWSEEDEKLVKNLISTLSNIYARNLIEKETKEKYTNFLKSLRPQSTWKPSDEQMKVLKEACVLKKSTATGAVLCDLYHDLEKLRDE